MLCDGGQSPAEPHEYINIYVIFTADSDAGDLACVGVEEPSTEPGVVASNSGNGALNTLGNLNVVGCATGSNL